MWVGDVLGNRFVIERPIGSGGMATVFQATDRRNGERVAVKAIEVTWEGSVERFQRETEILSELNHGAVVRYVAHGETDGAPFLVMELLEGEDLASRLGHRALTVAESLALARRVAEGLGAAHSKGVVHRDIKPSNLFLVDADPRLVKVVDFGVARLHARAQTMTRTGSMLGTIGYMAPEQATGQRDVDPRADVFAVGCVLFECLTGRPAFAGAHAVTVMAKVLCEEPPRASEIKPELAGPIDDLLCRMLAKDRGARPRDGSALAEELAWIEAHPTPPLGTRAEDARAPTTRATASVILGVPEATFVESLNTMTPTQAADETGRLAELAGRHRARLAWLEGRSIVLELFGSSAEEVALRAVACAIDLDRLDLGLSVALSTAPEGQVGVLIDEAFALLRSAGETRGTGRVIVDPATAEFSRTHFRVGERGSARFVVATSHVAGDDEPHGETLDVVGDDRIHGRSPMLQSFLERSGDDRKLGAFYLRKQLGRGGFAPVWLASEVYDEIELRTAAVKLFSFAARGDQGRGANRYREHVIREARSLCQVEHPNIVRFYTLLIEDDVGIAGLAMEYLGGSSLADRLRDVERLAVPETVRVGVAVASALDAAHRVGVIHRDVKPGNVMESPNGYKLIDFGIATADEIDAPPTPAVSTRKILPATLSLDVVGTKMSVLRGTTLAGERAGPPDVVASGTMGYIDPECIASGARATSASDLYSLGSLLFECLTGCVPAIAAATRPGLHAEVLDGRAAAPLVLSLAPDVPPALAALVDRLLIPDRARRPATAAAALSELEAIREEIGSGSRSAAVSSANVPASPVTPRRSWMPWGAAGAAGAVVIGVLASAIGGGHSPRDVEHVATTASIDPATMVAASPAASPADPRRVAGAIAIRPRTARVTVDGAPRSLGADGGLSLSGEPGSSFSVVVTDGNERRAVHVALLRDGRVDPGSIEVLPNPPAPTTATSKEPPLVRHRQKYDPGQGGAAPKKAVAALPAAAAVPFRHTRD